MRDNNGGRRLPIDRPVVFSEEEARLIRETRFFEVKAAVTQKVKVLLHQLQHTLQKEIDSAPFPAPPGFDPKNHQYVKGEHLRDFPYLYLDCPKHFKREEMLTFRTLFWWGHFFVFGWILGGADLPRYRRNLLARYDVFSGGEWYLLTADTPWEWRLAPECLLALRPENRDRAAAALAERPFLKLHRYLPLDPALTGEGVIAAARAAFRSGKFLLEGPHG